MVRRCCPVRRLLAVLASLTLSAGAAASCATRATPASAPAPTPSHVAPAPAPASQAAQEAAVMELFSRGLEPVYTGALPAGIDDLSAASCQGCHPEEAREWKQSLHRQAWSQPLFQQAYALEPMAECRNCHQPLTAGQPESAAVVALRTEGVNCATCHVRDGAILSPHRSGRAPHRVVSAPVMSAAAFCGGCHQFPFPERADGVDGSVTRVHHTREPMQDTLGEWQHAAKTGLTGESCQGCHMPWVTRADGRRRRSHRFPGGYDATLLRSAVQIRDVQARRVDGGVVLGLTLEAHGVGHAVPTGDLYRSLLVEAWTGAEDRASVQLTRHFVDVLDPDLVTRRRQAADDRLRRLRPGQPRRLKLQVRGPSARGADRVHYRISLYRLPPGQESPSADGALALSTLTDAEVPLRKEIP
jgi:hypothetical protein